MATINQIRSQIRFGLGQLSARNGHHEFEHLCRDFARKRICANILPATGPVQAGGDQGRDFETFRTYLAGNPMAQPTFVGLTTEKLLVFCCSLQKSIKSKIKDDIETVANSETKLDGVHYFCSEDLPIATRHELQDWAESEWKLHLDILDGQALSEQLAEPDLFPIAVEYLKIPPEIYPDSTCKLNEFISEYRQRMVHAFTRWEMSSLFGSRLVAGKPVEVDLDRMYLPVRLRTGDGGGHEQKNETISVEELLARDQPLIVRGPGGAGKTTWMRWIFRRLLDVEVALPIMLEVRQLANLWSQPKASRGQERSLDWFLDASIVEWVGGYSGCISLLLDNKDGPKPVLLVDGWDEMGEFGEELRSKLEGFRQIHPRMLVVVSSRPYGQAQPSAAGYEVRDIQPLSDDDIREFCDKFCRLFYSEEPDKSEALVNALKVSADALALARSPLLLTIILRVYRSGSLPRKRHRLYQSCLRELLTDYPDTKLRSGAEILPEQWYPDDPDERLHAAAELAHGMQHLGYEPCSYRLVQRDLIIRSREELINSLPSSWSVTQRNRFLEWLAGPAGLLDHQRDDSFQFLHLSFQEYLAALHLSKTNPENQVEAFVQLTDRAAWWETLRLGSELIADNDQSHISPILDATRKQGDSGQMLVGMILADGCGEESAFAQWLQDLLAILRRDWPKGADECARAWAVSSQKSRRDLMHQKLQDAFFDSDWLQWTRCREWFKLADFKSTFARVKDGSMASLVLDVLKGKLPTKQHLAVGRIFSVASAFWPIEPWELALVNVWPSQRRRAGRRLQALASLELDKDQLRDCARVVLAAHPTNDEIRSRALEILHPTHPEARRERDFHRELALELGRITWSGKPSVNFAYGTLSVWSKRYSQIEVNSMAEYLSKNVSRLLRSNNQSSRMLFENWDITGCDGMLIRAKLAHLESSPAIPAILLLVLACRVSLHPEWDPELLTQALQFLETSGIWTALAKHLARISTDADRKLLTEYAAYPERAQAPLSWGLQYIVRGDVLMKDGTDIRLDDLAAELSLPVLPLLDELPGELEE
jgi:hypothetical protein